jgi:5-methylcytosine-specific restriction endonuclease McrA
MGHRPELSTKRWRTLRKLVLERDNYICWMCGGRANQVDHLVPPPIGTDQAENLAAACGPCNNRKHHRYTDLPVLTVNW